jgi:benzoyl-CoA reductase/2-hydroxyglutaryl-CoA dehydratase subunit BcrC/BadD/HgdB
MTLQPAQINLEQWESHYAKLRRSGVCWPDYCSPLSRHVGEGDRRLESLLFDNSPAAFRLWNFLLTEEDRLHRARAEGTRLVGTMKDLGTVPVMAYSLDGVAAFYPDGAWWIPCVMELGAGLLEIADQMGVDESFCPVRAMLGAFINEAHFPIPDLLVCSAGAVCDDFSAISQRLNGMGFPILWWEIPHRRIPEKGEKALELPGGCLGSEDQVLLVKAELQRVRSALEDLAGQKLEDARLQAGIRKANQVRLLLKQLRDMAYGASICPMPALEMLIAEMLALHFCSDREEAESVLSDLVAVVQARLQMRSGFGKEKAARIFWVNPVADLRVMNLLEECGGRVCGTEYLFTHALDLIPEDMDPLEALARTALADPMVGSAAARAERICRDIGRFGAEAVVISRIPGASHCALEGKIISEAVQEHLGLPVLEIEIPPLTDSMSPTIRTRLEALVETVKSGTHGFSTWEFGLKQAKPKDGRDSDFDTDPEEREEEVEEIL